MKSAEIRKEFLNYFTGFGHLAIESSSLIPVNDPTLLLVNSGMAPLKPYFTGEEQPPQPRLCNIQKCIRTNDIELVGDSHHLTFFEMIGNWSIGDYFKEAAINFAWNVLQDVFGLGELPLYMTIYGGDESLPDVPPDDESREIWSGLISSDQIVPLGAASNFWGPTGKTGPCGPCTEIFVDRGEEYGCGKLDCNPECECGRFLEIWNAGVFMEYYLHEDNSLTALPLKSVDAGAGLDRFAVILQGVASVYETDLFQPIVDVATSGTNLDGESTSVRIITDHIRSATFMIADGIYPGRTKREYVLRRILRRALLHSHLSGIDPARLLDVSDTVIKMLSQYYPELTANAEVVKSIIRQSNNTFSKTLDRGLKEFNKIVAHIQGNLIPGEDVFNLHDRHGFPLELTKELAIKQGLQIDEEGYTARMEEQRRRSR